MGGGGLGGGGEGAPTACVITTGSVTLSMDTPICAERSVAEVLWTVAAMLSAADELDMINIALTTKLGADDGDGRGPQSSQSSAKLHMVYSEPAPPSSHSPSLACVQALEQPPEPSE